MKILLIGYGKMGKAIEQIAKSRSHVIAAAVDSFEQLTEFSGQADVAIEFTQPESVNQNLTYCFQRQLPVVCGTTGWLHEKSSIEKRCIENNGGFFYASNYSLGVNIFFKVNEYLAKLMHGQPGYTVSIEETHHTQKKDAPSGTAITLAEGIINNYPTKKQWTTEGNPPADSFVIRSRRIDPVPGTHTVQYASAIDDLEIKHTAHSREGFALGAVLVAEWMAGKKGIYSMDDFLKF